MPVFYLKTIMPQGEFKKWLIFLKDDQPDVMELQMATLTATVANAVGGKRKVGDFIIRKPSENKPMLKTKGVTANEVRSALGMFATKKL